MVTAAVDMNHRTNNGDDTKSASSPTATTPTLSPSPSPLFPNLHPNSELRTNTPQHSRRERKRLKKAAALQRRAERIAKNGGPPSTTFLGKHKWLGGAVDTETGCIYGIPSHSHQIICIKPSSNNNDKAEISMIPLPAEYQQGHFKWLRGVVHDGHLYGIPAWNTKGVLKVNLHTQEVSVLLLPHNTTHYEAEPIVWKERVKEVDRGRWMWHGGAVAQCGNSSSLEEEEAIYCPPSNAEYVLKVYLDGSDRVEEIGMPLSVGQNKWYGGILGVDGCVYAPPYTATGVLRIDPKTDSVQVLGDFPVGEWKWHGGLLAKSTGVIYAFPAHSNEVLCIDTNVKKGSSSDGEVVDCDDDESWRVSTIPIQRHENDTDSPNLKYKWLGGSYGADGCIYGMPSDATSILRIDPINNVATTFGNVPPSVNKWQGGVLSRVDKCFYAVPADMDCILRVDTDPDTPLSISYVCGGFQDVDDKWQGGFVGSDGKIYAIPENINNVMKITPGDEPLVEMLL
eukprot:CAMPEP_0181131978 /NCGR_PEP_ID=MMETSP1071-20121207/30747_1 /TAXON_ID=35127 /ORGANISM="Thalassiosira sp., Strain NH16" /LENGTH=509 /DNA_ID=CAMNT_0023218275 /DNA_START=353 /DNA_END=1882 /DNA_ORIENTATION=+